MDVVDLLKSDQVKGDTDQDSDQDKGITDQDSDQDQTISDPIEKCESVALKQCRTKIY